MSSLEDLRELVRSFLACGQGWCGVVVLTAGAWLVARFITWAGARLALLPVGKQPPPVHWTGQARLAYPCSVVLVVAPLLLLFVFYQASTAAHPLLTPVPQGILSLLLPGAAFVGAVQTGSRIESRLRQRPVSLADGLRSWAIVVLLFIPHLILFSILLFHGPERLDAEAAVMIGLALAAAILFACDGGLILARLCGLVRPAPPRLIALAEAAAQSVGTRPRSVHLLRWKAATALAFPLTRRIAMTDTALGFCTDAEATAVCAHELGHLSEPRRIALARLAGQFVWLPFFAYRPITGSLGMGPGLLLIAALVVVGSRLLKRLTRAMEVRADAIGRTHEGDAGTYARALERLYQVNLMPAVMRQKRLTHPHLYDRLLAAGIPPDFPRPEPPSRWRVPASLVGMGALALAFLWSWDWLLK
jgi:Zn-dependent protease with chaperone function